MQTQIVEIRKRLRACHNFRLRTRILEGLQLFILITSLHFFIITVFEMLLHGGTTFRTMLACGWMINAVTLGLIFLLWPAINRLLPFTEKKTLQTAIFVGRFFTSIADRLYNVLQLTNRPSEANYDNPFTLAAVEQIYTTIEPIDLKTAVNQDNLRKLFRFSGITALTILMLVIFIPQLNQSAGRILLFGHQFTAPAKYIIKISPGNVKVTRGAAVRLRVFVLGGSPGGVQLITKDKEQSKPLIRYINQDSTGEYIALLSNIHSDLQYSASVEGIESERYLITVIDRPLIKDMVIKVTPPAYTKLPAAEQRDNGSFQTLVGSTMAVSLSASKPLSKAYLVINDSSRVPMSVIEQNAAVTTTIRKDFTYHFEVFDHDSNANENPVTFTVKTVPDLNPSIEILSPDQNIALTAEQRIQLNIKISDDYGFSHLRLFYRLSASKYVPAQKEFTVMQIPFDISQHDELVGYIWNLSPLSLATEDVITYYAEVADNDNFGGPKTARTAEFTARIPSLQELLKKSETAQDKAGEDLEKTLKEATDLKKEMEQLRRDLRKDKREVNWEEKERVQQAAKKFEDLQNKVDQIQKQVQEAAKNLQQNNLLSKETMQKYMELQKLMKEMSSEEMRKAMEKLQQTLQNLDRKQIQQELANMKFDEEAFQKSVERTLNLLKRVQIEQKLDELVKRTEKMEQQQQDLAEQAAKQQNKQNQDGLKKQQKEISKQIDQLKQEMKDLAEKMKEMKDLPNDKMQDIEKEFDEQKNDELSEQAEQDLQDQAPQKASQKQSQISKNMKKMKSSLKNMQSAIQQQQQMQTFKDMTRMLKDLISLSKEEEQLKKSSSAGEREMSFSDNAHRQDGIKRNLENISQGLNKLSQKTFAVTPEMGKSLGDARREMDQAIASLQNKNGPGAAGQQGEAMKSLNEAAAMMKQSMDNMMQQGGQGGGMMSLMQQLGQLSGQQMSLNNLSQQLMQGNNGQLNQEQMAQLQRLAQQQDMIRKSMEQLEREARNSGQSKKLPGNLNEITRQMQEVVSDMKTQQSDDKFLQKQERILSKLLDIQRSINERDFEKDRESFSGTNVNRTSPADLKKQQGKQDKLKDEINRSQQEGYLKDYEDLIKKYLEKLQKEL